MPINTIPQAPRYTNDQLFNIAEMWRQNPDYGSRFINLTDAEILDKLRREFIGYQNLPTPHRLPPELIEQSENQRLAFSKETSASSEDLIDDSDVKNDDFDKLHRTNSGYPSWIMGGAVLDMLPEWLGNVVKSGANESLTGMAVHLLWGDEPFNLEGMEEPGVLESALSFGFSMIYDSWFFALTRGLGIIPRLAGQQAKEMAAKEIAAIFMRQNAIDDAAMATYGLTSLGKRKVAALIKKDAKTGVRKTADEMTEAFKKAGVDEVKANKLLADSVKQANKYVNLQTSGGSREFMKSGLTEVAGHTLKHSIDAPVLNKMFHEFGKTAAGGLGLYSAATDFEQQFVSNLTEAINPETGQPYTYGEALGAFELWKRGDTSVFKEGFDYDFRRTATAALHGYVGGYVAGGLGGIWKMGRMGVFEEAGWNKSIQKRFPEVNKALFSHFVGVPVEGFGFAVTGAGLNFADKALGGKGDDISFGERLLKDIVTIGVLKGMHGTMDYAKQKAAKTENNMIRAVLDFGTKEIEKLDKIKLGIDTTTVAGQEQYKQVTALQVKANKAIEKRVKEIRKVWADMIELTQKFPFLKKTDKSGRVLRKNTTATAKDADVLQELVGKIQRINEEIIDQTRGQPELIRAIMEDDLLKRFFDDVQMPDGRDSPLWKSIKKQVKNAKETVDKTDKSTPADANLVSQQKSMLESRNVLMGLGIERIASTKKGVKDVAIEEASQKELESAVDAALKKKEDLLDRTDKAEDLYDKNADSIDAKMGDIGGAEGKHGPAIRQAIAKAEGTTLGKVLKRIVGWGLHTGNKGGLKSKVVLATRFEKWLKKRGTDILDATISDMDAYLKTGNKGGPFANVGGKSGMQSRARYVMAAIIREPHTFLPQEIKITMQETTTKRRPLEPEDFQKAQDGLQEILKDGEPIPVNTSGSNSITTNVAHAINYIMTKLGSRRDRIFGGTKDENPPLLVKDVVNGPTIAGEKTLILNFTTKIKKGGKRQVMPMVVINRKIGAEQINYYKVFNEIRGSGRSGNEFLLRTSANKKINNAQFDFFVKRFMLGGEKKGVTAHTIRNSVIAIAEAMDVAGIRPDKGTGIRSETWAEIVDKMFLSHTPHSSMKELYKEFFTNKNPAFLKQKLFILMDFWNKSGEVTRKLTKKELIEREKLEREILDRIESPVKKPKKGGKKQITTSREPLTKEAIEAHIDEVMGSGKYPGLKAIVTKDTTFAGSIKKGIIRLAEGKADETTIFHELVHGLEDVVRGSKNKDLIRLWDQGESIVANWALKNDSSRWKGFLKEYKTEKKAANEYLTQLAAEWSVERFNAKTKIGKFGVWIRELMSGIKNFFGVGSPKDVARVFGKMAERGFSLEGQKIALTRYQKQIKENQEGPSASEREMRDIEDVLASKKMHYKEQLTLVLDRLGLLGKFGVPTSNISIVKKGKEAGKFVGLTSEQAQNVYKFIVDFIPEYVKGETATWNKANQRAHLLQVQKGITTQNAEMIKKTLGIPHGSLKYATKEQLVQYIEMIEKVGRDYDHPDTIFDLRIADNLAQKNKKFKKLREQTGFITLSVSMVLRKFGGKKGAEVARAFEDHYLSEAQFIGRGMVYVSSAAHELGFGHRGRMKFIPFALDPELLAPYEVGGKMITPEGPKGLKEFMDSAEKGKRDVGAGGKGTKESRAVQHIDDMYTYYWGQLKVLASEKIPNPALYEKWLETNKKLYVKDYFTHVLTKEAREHFKVGTAGFDKGIEELRRQIFDNKTKDLVEEVANLELAILDIPLNSPKRRDLEALRDKTVKEYDKWLKASKDPSTDLAKDVRNDAYNRMFYSIHKRRFNVKNRFLLKRNPLLKNYVVNEEGKHIKVWETDFEKVAGQYLQVFSSYLATVKHFNEFTDVTGDFTRTSSVQKNIIDTMVASGEVGAYMSKVLRRRIGMEDTDLLHQPMVNGMAHLARYSALFGLSSPYSGIKNLSIGTMNTIGIHGVIPFFYGVTQVLRPSAWKYAEMMGWMQLGTKDINLTRPSNWWMTWISWMKPTEKINRVVGGFAGEMSARMLVKRIKGDEGSGNILSRKWSGKLAAEELVTKFGWTVDDVAFAAKHGLDPSDIRLPSGRKGSRAFAAREGYEVRQIALIQRAQQYGHIKTQGATGDPFLPYWAGGGFGKSMTLFYRMAYSSTSNIYHHILVPATKGNFLPLARHTLAGTLFGSALWNLYEQVLGSKPPKLNEEEQSNLFQNLAKTEALALYSWALNPYAPPGQPLEKLLLKDSIMQPAVLRNMYNAASWGFNLIRGKGIAGPADFSKYVKESIVAINHLEQFLTKQRSPYKTNYKNIKKFKNMYFKKIGKWKDENMGNNPERQQIEVSQQYRLIREAFNNDDLKSAARYYVATYYHMYDTYRITNGREDKYPAVASQLAHQRLQAMMKHLNPVLFADTKGKSRINLKKEFLNYLKPEERRIAKNVEKQYWYRYRKFNKEVSKLWEFYGGKYRAGQIVDMFPLPPRDSFLGYEYKGEEGFKTSTRKSRLGF